MASTNKTSNLQLSQFIATDTPTWLVDYNGDMEKIDAGVGRVEELAETASTQAVGVASGLQATNQTVTTLSGQVANVQNQSNSATASVNGINQRLGNTDISGIGDGTITGAINAQNSNLIEIYKNNLSSQVDLKAYNSSSNPFEIPSDGYISFGSSTTDTCLLFLLGNNKVNQVGARINPVNGTASGFIAYVKKGMYVYATGTVGTFYYYALE